MIFHASTEVAVHPFYLCMRSVIAASLRPKDDSYRDLSRLLRSVCPTALVVVYGHFNIQLSPFSVPVDRTDNEDRGLQVCPDQRLFLANTNFYHRRRHHLHRRPPSHSQCWNQIDQWRASIEDCQPFWSTLVDSDHALDRTCSFTPSHRSHQHENHMSRAAQLILDDNHPLRLKSELTMQLFSPKMPRIQANTASRSKKSYTRRQLPRRTTRHVSPRNDGYPRPLLFC